MNDVGRGSIMRLNESRSTVLVKLSQEHPNLWKAGRRVFEKSVSRNVQLGNYALIFSITLRISSRTNLAVESTRGMVASRRQLRICGKGVDGAVKQ